MNPSQPSSSSQPRPVSLKALLAQKAGALNARDSVETAGERMREQGAADWPVAKSGRLVGTVREQNPDWKLGGHGHDPKQWEVGQIMREGAVFCLEDDDCARAAELMAENQLDHLPVVDAQMNIVAILSRRELEEMTSGSPERENIARRATEIARKHGRVVFTDDDLAKAREELEEPMTWPTVGEQAGEEEEKT